MLCMAWPGACSFSTGVILAQILQLSSSSTEEITMSSPCFFLGTTALCLCAVKSAHLPSLPAAALPSKQIPYSGGRLLVWVNL